MAKIEPATLSMHVAKQVAKNVAEERTMKAAAVDMFLTGGTFLSLPKGWSG
jgi:hypothetical protein